MAVAVTVSPTNISLGESESPEGPVTVITFDDAQSSTKIVVFVPADIAKKVGAQMAGEPEKPSVLVAPAAALSALKPTPTKA